MYTECYNNTLSHDDYTRLNYSNVLHGKWTEGTVLLVQLEYKPELLLVFMDIENL